MVFSPVNAALDNRYADLFPAQGELVLMVNFVQEIYIYIYMVRNVIKSHGCDSTDGLLRRPTWVPSWGLPFTTRRINLGTAIFYFYFLINDSIFLLNNFHFFFCFSNFYRVGKLPTMSRGCKVVWGRQKFSFSLICCSAYFCSIN